MFQRCVETTFLEFGDWVKKHTQICCDSNCREWTVFNCCTTSWPYNKTCVNKVNYTLKSSIQHILISKDLFLEKNIKLTQKVNQDQDQIHPFFQPTTKRSQCPTDSQGLINVHTLAIRSSESFSIPPGKPKNFLRKATRPQGGESMVNGQPTFSGPPVGHVG